MVPKFWNKKTAATNGWLIEIIRLDANRNSLTVWDDNRIQILKPAWVNLKFDAQATNTTKVYIKCKGGFQQKSFFEVQVMLEIFRLIREKKKKRHTQLFQTVLAKPCESSQKMAVQNCI